MFRFVIASPCIFLLLATLSACSSSSGTSKNENNANGTKANLSALIENGQKTRTMNAKQAYKTALGTMYLCWMAALRTDRHADADALAKHITSFNEKYPDIKAHRDDFVLFAAKDLNKIKAKGELEVFYEGACKKPIDRLQRAIKEGMMG